MTATHMRSYLFSLTCKITLQSRYYNIGEREGGRYLVQTRLQAKSSGIMLPEVCGVDKEIDPHIRPEKQVINPMVTSEAKCVSQIK